MKFRHSRPCTTKDRLILRVDRRRRAVSKAGLGICGNADRPANSLRRWSGRLLFDPDQRGAMTLIGAAPHAARPLRHRTERVRAAGQPHPEFLCAANVTEHRVLLLNSRPRRPSFFNIGCAFGDPECMMLSRDKGFPDGLDAVLLRRSDFAHGWERLLRPMAFRIPHSSRPARKLHIGQRFFSERDEGRQSVYSNFNTGCSPTTVVARCLTHPAM